MLNITRNLEVPLVKKINSNTPINKLAFLLDNVRRNVLNQVPWGHYNYCPAVEFAMTYDYDCIFLKFYVFEKSIRAVNNTVNSAVWEDSCVEFFISFDGEAAYYNLEFNCIGTARVGYGQSKHDRQLLPQALISQIKYQSVINNHHEKDIHWELTVSIPKNLFCFNTITSHAGKKCRANFYKCGDNLPTPHFIAWSGIQSAEPDFHLPEFFGTLHFVKE